MNKKYRVLFHGLVGDEESFKARMIDLGAPPETVDRMLGKAPVILKEDLPPATARRYADAVQAAGGRVTIQECGYFVEPIHNRSKVSIASFEAFTMCPECGFKQQKGKACVKCGFQFNTGPNSEAGKRDDPGY